MLAQLPSFLFLIFLFYIFYFHFYTILVSNKY
jgi:hypothetical protein